MLGKYIRDKIDLREGMLKPLDGILWNSMINSTAYKSAAGCRVGNVYNVVVNAICHRVEERIKITRNTIEHLTKT